jgi:hypothetical protein
MTFGDRFIMEPNQHTEDATLSAAGEASRPTQAEQPTSIFKGVMRLWDGLIRVGLGESALRIGTGLLSVAFILVVVWVMGKFYVGAPKDASAKQASLSGSATQTPVAQLPAFDLTGALSLSAGIGRISDIHTILPTRPRFDVVIYKVVKGDTVIGIAEKFV